jgi:hypothetical protein
VLDVLGREPFLHDVLASGRRASACDSNFDARGTSGISRDVPIGVQEITIVAELETGAADAVWPSWAS